MVAAFGRCEKAGDRKNKNDVDIKFTAGNCYGLIGASGTGKSTFLKILSGAIAPHKGTVSTGPGERIAVLKRDHFAFDDKTVIDTVIMGHDRLHAILMERNTIYAKADFTAVDGIRSGELEAAFAEMDGYAAESQAAVLLKGLGIAEEALRLKMKELEGGAKVRVLLAQVFFGNPDVLLLDEPTNHLCLEAHHCGGSGLVC